MKNYIKVNEILDEFKSSLIEKNKNYYQENKQQIDRRHKKWDQSEKGKEYKRQYRQAHAKYNTYFEKLNKYEEVRKSPDNPDLIQVKCTYCDRWFNPTNMQVVNRLKAITKENSRGELRFYCSENCKWECQIYHRKTTLRGSKNKSINSSETSPELRKMVLKRDNYTCQKCYKIDVPLHCHHIDPVINNPIESADIDNCITLCKDCHKFIHTYICSTSDLTKCGVKKTR